MYDGQSTKTERLGKGHTDLHVALLSCIADLRASQLSLDVAVDAFSLRDKAAVLW